MGVRVLEDKDDGYKCLYCSTTMIAFGNIFYDYEDVEDFLEWLGEDARKLSEKELDNKVYEWRKLQENLK